MLQASMTLLVRVFNRNNVASYICIYVTEPAIPYPYKRELHFEYVDHHNSQKADDSKMKDL